MSDLNKILKEFTEELGLIALDLKFIEDYAKDFPPGGQDTFNRKLTNFVSKLMDLSKVAKGKELQDIQIPIAVFQYIDNDISPVEYNKDVLKNIISLTFKLNTTNNKMSEFQKILIGELGKEFPDIMKKYTTAQKHNRMKSGKVEKLSAAVFKLKSEK